jgi:hypothetical protein
VPSAVVGVNETVSYSINPANPDNAASFYVIEMKYKVLGSTLSGAYPIQLQGVCSGTVVINFATCASDPTCVSKLNGPPPGTASPTTLPTTSTTTTSSPPYTTLQPTTGSSSIGSSGLSETVTVLIIIVVSLFAIGMVWLCRNRISQAADASTDDVTETAPLNTFET